jgi:hypothetical protein
MLIEYYECDCSYKVTRDDIDTEKIVLASHMVNEVIEVICYECGGPYGKRVQTKRYICPNPKCGKDLVLKEESIGDDVICVNKIGNVLQVMGTPYTTPIHSDALALTPENVAEHKEKFPDIEIDSELRPVFTNAKQHEDYMNKCGIRKQTQRTGRSKSKIYSYPGSKCS